MPVFVCPCFTPTSVARILLTTNRHSVYHNALDVNNRNTYGLQMSLKMYGWMYITGCWGGDGSTDLAIMQDAWCVRWISLSDVCFPALHLLWCDVDH
jgi:hypothetical protein